MPIKGKSRFWLLVALQVLFLLFLAGSYYGVELFGREIRLKTAPLDPRDLFYGDYVVLNYEINMIPLSLWKGDKEPVSGDRIFVLLQEKGGLYRAAAAFPEKPDLNNGEAVLTASVVFTERSSLRLRYGLERYYVPEGTGKDLEQRRADMIVRVKIAPWGQAKISGLEL